MPNEQELSDLKLQVGLMGRDIQQNTMFFDRLSQSIEKIQEVNYNLLRMISLHEEKHEQHERFQEDFQQDIKDLHSRITSSIRDVMDAIDKSETKVIQLIESHLKQRPTQGDHDDISWHTILSIGKYSRLLWAVIVAVFFIGYYVAKIQPFFVSLLGK